jgi:hypothetical protein
MGVSSGAALPCSSHGRSAKPAPNAQPHNSATPNQPQHRELNFIFGRNHKHEHIPTSMMVNTQFMYINPGIVGEALNFVG